MKKEPKTDVKSKVINGTSAAAGAAIGVVAGNIAATEAYAAETPEVPEEAGVTGDAGATISPADSNTHETGNTNVIEPEPVPEPEPEPVPEPTPEPTPGPTGPIVPPENPEDPEIVVLDNDTITNDDGSQMDVAVISVNGQEACLIDVNQDGTVDLIATDANGDYRIDENEIVDIEGAGISMASFQQETMDDTLIADNDYVNDANVDDYMA